MASVDLRLAVLATALLSACEKPAPPQEPPPLALASADPAVARAVHAARAAVLASRDSAEAWGRLGMVLVAHELDEVAAELCFARAEQLAPADARWPFHRAQLLADHKSEAAIAALERAVHRGGGQNPAVVLELSELLLRHGRREEATRHASEVLRRDPANAWAHLVLARALLESGRLAESLEHLGRAGSPHTRKAAHTLAAQVRLRLGEKEAADTELRAAAVAPDDSPWPNPFREEMLALRIGKRVRLSRADHLLAGGRVTEAINALELLVKDYAEDDWAWLVLGRAYLKRQDLPAAERALRRTVALSPESAKGQFDLGLVLYLRHERAAAAECFRAAIKSEPGFANAHYNLAQCLADEGDQAGAMAGLRTALRCKPDYVLAHVALGELLVLEGQIAEAIAQFQGALELDPANEKARRALAELP